MIFQRTIIQDLRKWAGKSNRKPLILRGARQVGKTTVVEQFAQEFDKFIKLNLEDEKQLQYFDPVLNIREIVDTLYVSHNITSVNSKILIFIDEIQNSPQAVKMLRYFHEEMPHLYVIAAGSLLETVIGKNISFPVGRVEYLRMYPCTFDEFLLAIGELSAREALQRIPFPDNLHQVLLDKFKLYSIVGGMPEVVQNFSIEKQVHSLNSLYEGLIVSFMDDVEKYARNDTLTKVIRHTIKHSLLLAGSRIKFQGFGGSDYKNREMAEAFQMLQKAFILQLVYPITNTTIPQKENIRRSPKIQMMDTGLVIFYSGAQQDMLLAKSIDDVFQGRMSEHISAQELKALSNSPLSELHFWTRERADADAEVDFVFQHEGKIFPVEVKSGATGKLRSLFQFIDSSPHPFAVRVYSGKLHLEKGKTRLGNPYTLLNLPFYLVHKLPEYLDWMISETID